MWPITITVTQFKYNVRLSNVRLMADEHPVTFPQTARYSRQLHSCPLQLLQFLLYVMLLMSITVVFPRSFSEGDVR
jgi:hypothetical protein